MKIPDGLLGTKVTVHVDGDYITKGILHRGHKLYTVSSGMGYASFFDYEVLRIMGSDIYLVYFKED